MSATWHIDDFVVHKVVEDLHGYSALDRFLPDLTPKQLAANVEWFANDGYDIATRAIVFSYHSYVLETPGGRVMIDTCVGNHKTVPFRDAWNDKRDTRWLDDLAATGLTVDDIDYVVCSHLHHDHVGWNTSYRDGRWHPTFPNARYVIVNDEYVGTRDWDRLHAGESDPLGLGPILKTALDESVVPVLEAGQLDLVPADHRLNDHVRFLPTHGHTAGHIAVIAGRERDAAVFTGDLVHSPIQLVYPDLRFRADDDVERAWATRNAFLERYADTDTLVFTMHFLAPSAGHLHRTNGGGFRLEYVEPS